MIFLTKVLPFQRHTFANKEFLSFYKFHSLNKETVSNFSWSTDILPTKEILPTLSQSKETPPAYKDSPLTENIPIVDFHYNVSGENYKQKSAKKFAYDSAWDPYNFWTGPNPDDRSILVVPRRAYYDTRLVDGKPRNILVILTESEIKMLDKIVACEINGYYSKQVETLRRGCDWVTVNRPGHSHCGLTVECIGLPRESIINGSNTRVIYKLNEDRFYSRVRTEKPLLLTTPVLRRGSVLVCTPLFGHPPKFNAWLRYQKTLGVDLVKLSVHPTFAENATQLYPFLKVAIDSGLVEMEIWPDITGNRYYYHGQTIKYQDCIYKYLGMYEYAFFLDYDDFFNPLSQNKDIHYYTDILFASNITGSSWFKWMQTEWCIPKEQLMTAHDGNLTRLLPLPVTRRMKNRSVGKSAVRISAVRFMNIHTVYSFLPQYESTQNNRALAYVAHIRNASNCKEDLASYSLLNNKYMTPVVNT